MGKIAIETKRRATWPWVLLGTSALALLLLWAGYHLLREWQARSELAQAQKEIQRGALIEASQRLIALAASRPGALGGSVDYWLGVVEATRGDDSAAFAAFVRVPLGYKFDSQGAFLEARANLQMGRFRRAERRLVGMLAGKGQA